MLHRATGLLRRPIAVTSWCVAIILAGIWAALDLPIEYTPSTELPQVRIQASWHGASPRQVERYVTAPIEREVQTVPGVAEITSLSREHRSHVTIQVDEDVDLSMFATQVGEKLTLLRGQLPDRVVPQLTKEIPEAFQDMQGFMTIQILGPYLPDELREYADEVLKPQFQSLHGIDLVEVMGGTKRELLISLDPNRLDAYDIGPATVAMRVRQSLQDHVFGRLDAQGRSHLLISRPELDIERLSAIIVNDTHRGVLPVRLDQIADLRLGPAPRVSISRTDGLPVVVLELERTRGAHMIAVAESVYDRIDEIEGTMPPGMRLIVMDDRTEDVRALLYDLAWRGGIALILVVFVLLFMLKRIRATAVVLLSVAVAFAPSIALFRLFDLSLNIITLAGLVLVFGLLVDNSVVVIEQLILQRRKWGRRSLKKIELEQVTTRAALQAVWFPLLGGTLSTMAVMLPLVYLSGDLRGMFLPFGILVSLMLLISLASAVFVVPVLGRFLPPKGEAIERRWLRRLIAMPYKWVARFPKLTLAVLLLLLGTPVWLLPNEISAPRNDWSSPSKERFAGIYNVTVGSNAVQGLRPLINTALGGVLYPFFRNASFYKPWEFGGRKSIPVNMQFPPGNVIEKSDSLMQRFEQIALASESVYRVTTRITEQSANMRVEFKDGSLMTAEPYIVQNELVREAILVGGIYIYVGGLIPQTSYSSGGGSSLGGERVDMYGPNYEELDDLAERFAAFAKRRSRRVMGVETNRSRGGWLTEPARQVLQFEWNSGAQARTGVTPAWLAGRLRPYFYTKHRFAVADIGGDTQVPIRLIVDHAEEIGIDRVTQRPLALRDSALVRLAGLADYNIVETPLSIERENQRYVRHLTIDFRGPFNMSRKFVEDAVSSFPVPAGYEIKSARYFFFTDETKRAFSWVFIATLVLVFLVTASIFESWRLPFVVMLSVPLAAVGLCLGFLLTGASFVEGAFIGTVLLVGIAVNDSILLTYRFRQMRDIHPHGNPSVLARLAVRERLRPMWTTTLTSVVAMLPMLVFTDKGDFWTGLAVTVTGGLLASTLLAPVASVAMLSLFKPRPLDIDPA